MQMVVIECEMNTLFSVYVFSLRDLCDTHFILTRIYLLLSLCGSHHATKKENIDSYINACKKIGVPEEYQFVTVDLYEGKNLGQVALNIISVKRQLGFGFQKMSKDTSSSPSVHVHDENPTSSSSTSRNGTLQQRSNSLSIMNSIYCIVFFIYYIFYDVILLVLHLFGLNLVVEKFPQTPQEAGIKHDVKR